MISGPLVVVIVGILLNKLLGGLETTITQKDAHLVNIPIANSTSEFLSFFRLPDWSFIANTDVWITAITLALVASLEKSEEKPFVYDPSGKRDPFRQFDFAPKTDNSTAKTELEKYSIGQLKVTAILDGFTEPMAMVENEAGRGFRIKKGVKIGTNNGEVIEVQKDRILVLETNVDFTGESKTRTIEMRLRTKDQEEKVFPAPR